MSQDYKTINIFSSSKNSSLNYELSPIARNTIENNQVKIINYRGIKLTSFYVDGRQLICLPQAFEFFLKNFVGGLHTVYTKLKRLEIIPIVCNVEQVRVLRSLGAIQPGVNRCKLLAPHEFDILYDDCMNCSSRPGRPPKRNPSYQTDDYYSDDKRLKCPSNFLFHSFSDFKYPIHSTLTHSYLSNNTQPITTTTTSHRSISSNESRSFTIDAMLNHNRDHLTKSIDLSMTNIDQTLSTTPVNFFHIKNMIELTIDNARQREKQLENEIVDLKTEITKEQDCRQKLQQDFLQLQRIRNILNKKLKRLNRSNNCSNSNKNNLFNKSSSNTIQIELI